MLQRISALRARLGPRRRGRRSRRRSRRARARSAGGGSACWRCRSASVSRPARFSPRCARAAARCGRAGARAARRGRRRRRLRGGLDHRAHAGDQAGVDAVGLGVGADGLGEAPDAGRVQLRRGDIGPVQRPLEGGVIGAGRLEGDARDVRSDPAEEPPVPGGVVADAAGLAARPAAGVEMVFRDVDADGRLLIFSGAPCLSCEPRARVSVRVSGRTRGDPTLHRPLRACSRAIRPLAAAGGWPPSGGVATWPATCLEQTSSRFPPTGG